MPETIMQLRPETFSHPAMELLRSCLKKVVVETLNPIVQEERGRPYEVHNIKVKTEWTTEDDDPDIRDYQIRIMVERWSGLAERRDEVAQNILTGILDAIPSHSGRGFVQVKLTETGFAIAAET